MGQTPFVGSLVVWRSRLNQHVAEWEARHVLGVGFWSEKITKLIAKHQECHATRSLCRADKNFHSCLFLEINFFVATLQNFVSCRFVSSHLVVSFRSILLRTKSVFEQNMAIFVLKRNLIGSDFDHVLSNHLDNLFLYHNQEQKCPSLLIYRLKLWFFGNSSRQSKFCNIQTSKTRNEQTFCRTHEKLKNISIDCDEVLWI